MMRTTGPAWLLWPSIKGHADGRTQEFAMPFFRSRWCATERQIAVVRALIRHAESWATFVENVSPDEYGYTMDAVDDGYILLKQMAGSPVLAVPTP
jgi:hypothetical protein